MRCHFAVRVVAACGLAPLCSSCALAQAYDVIEVPTYVTSGAGLSYGRGINRDGYVVGETQTDSGFAVVLVDPSGQAQNFNFLDSPDWGGSASAINGLRQIAGGASNKFSGAATAYRYSPGQGFVDLEELPGGETSVGLAINSSGVVVGWSNRGTGCSDLRCPENPGFAVRWADVKAEPVGGLAGFSVATGINDLGEMCGFGSEEGVATTHAYRFGADGQTAQKLGTFSDLGTGANAINNLGWIVGNAQQTNLATRAVLWRPGNEIENLGALDSNYNSVALAVNNIGDIVGYSLEFGSNFPRATLFHRGGTAIDLNRFIPPGWNLQIAYGVNDRGMICGWAWHGQVSRGFILIPHINYKFERISATKGRFSLETDFNLEYTTDLANPVWTPAPEIKLAVDQHFEVEVDLSGQARFYRLLHY